MNLLVSYNWLKEFVNLGKSPEIFAKEFSLKSQTVDRIEKISPKFKGVITAKIKEIKPHPNADRLRLVTVSNGKSQQVVVCGAPNIEVGQIVPLAKIGSTVLNSKAEGESFVISKVRIRDVESDGMICSAKELGLGQNHEGIMILPSNTKVGQKLEDVVSLNDSILDIEVTTNRPDAMSILGLAQEAAAVFGQKFNFKIPKPKINKKFLKPLSVVVQDSKLCPRYQAVVMTDFKVGPSPLWLSTRLISAGLKPINNLVDITNYIAFEYGQPMHVFDYDKIKGQKIVIRKAKIGESIKALDDNNYKLSSDNLVIADAKNPIAIAGVMGGADSASYDTTKTLIFEAANFNPVSVRRTARSLNLYSDSSSRFEKGLHPEGVTMAMLRAIQLASDIAGATTASPIIDVYREKYKPVKIKFSLTNIKRYLGVSLETKQVKKILESLGFKVLGSQPMTVTVPWWRTNDISTANDLVEEIARIYGYDKFEASLPDGKLPKSSTDSVLFWERETKNYLVGIGLTEVYNYSFLSKDLLSKVGLSTKKAIRIANPLNEDMEYLRTTLIPQLLQNVSENADNFSTQKIFELSNVYEIVRDKDLPHELPRLTGAVAGVSNQFLVAKGIVELLLKKLGTSKVELILPDFHNLMWSKGSSLDVKIGGKFIGQIGNVKKEILTSFGISDYVTIFDLDFNLLADHASTIKNYIPIPEFPGVDRDLSVVIDQNVNWQKIKDVVVDLHELIVGTTYLSTYQDKSLGEGKKALAFRIDFRSKERTLKSSEIDEIMGVVTDRLEKEFNAILR